MLHHLAGLLRRERAERPVRRRWASWLGRNLARVSYGIRIEPTWLELNQLDVPVAGLPAAFTGFRIVQLTDLHCSKHITSEYLDEAIGLAQAQKPDLAVLTGDFIHKGFKHIDRVADRLATLHAPAGVFAVLGNHDYSVRNALGIRRYKHLHYAVAEALSARGITVLRNESIRLERDDAGMFLTGVEDLWSRDCDVERAMKGLCPKTPRIVLAHNPQTVERLAGHRCDLMLSGHTHGGQINLPGLGRPTLTRRAKRFAAGLYHYNDTYLYVNKGVGFGIRFRYGVRPEVAVATLRPACDGEVPKCQIVAPQVEKRRKRTP